MNRTMRIASRQRQDTAADGPRAFPAWLEGGDGSRGQLCLPVRAFAQREVICRQGEPLNRVHFVQRGSLSLTRLAPDGRESLLSVVTTGDFFGETALLNGSVSSFNAVALERGTLLELSSAKFLRMLEDPRVSLRFLAAMARRCDDAWMQMEAMSCARAEDKVRSVLLWLCAQAVQSSTGGIRIALNQTQLACMVGCSRETFARSLAQFRKGGVVEVRCERGRKVLYVLDPGALGAAT